MARRATAIAACCLLAGCASHARPAVPHGGSRAERALAASLDRIFSDPTMGQALWGVEIKSLTSGRTLYERNPRTLMMPASNMKIVTLAVAAETLGWDYRFKTSLETAAPVVDGVLQGDLFIRGGGDPSINARGDRANIVLDGWAAALKAGGIRRIDGNIAADARAFDRAWLGNGWAWDDLQYGYAAPVGALEFNENNAVLTITPGAAPGDPATITITAGSGLRLDARMTTGAAGSPTTLDYDRRPSDDVLIIRGSVAVGDAAVTRGVAVVNPALFFAQQVRDGLAARGIAVSGAAVDIEDAATPPPAAGRRVLAELLSPPLRDIATVMMKVSQNLYAETLLKTVGLATSGTGSVEAGHAASQDVLGRWGIPETGYVQRDGSGLSRYDYVTADMLVTILSHLYGDPRHREAFVSTLPIAGTDGTIATRMKKTPAEGNAVAKTGSIANVRTLSGFVKAADGEMIVFSIVGNNFTVPAATVNGFADQAVARLAAFGGR